MIEPPKDLKPLILQGDCFELMEQLPEGSVHEAVTSTPYWGLRDYAVCPCSVDREIVSEFHTRPPTRTDPGGGILQNIPKEPDPNCKWCKGTGRIPEVAKGRIWGGKEGCAHSWSTTAPRRDRRKDWATNDTEKASLGGRNYDAQPTETCLECGAWKGNLGSEPLHDCLAWARGEPPCPRCFVCHIRVLGATLWRVLRDDGTWWLNLGDTYSTHPAGLTGAKRWKASTLAGVRDQSGGEQAGSYDKRVPGLKEKDLAMIPARCALALQADGWYLRAENPNPDSDGEPQVIWCLSGGAKVYAKTQTIEGAIAVKDMVRLRPETVMLWTGTKWTQVLGTSHSGRSEQYELELRSGERIGCTAHHLWPTTRGLVETSAIRVGDCLLSVVLPEAEDPRVVDHVPGEFGWVVGLYLAEGSRSEGTLQFAGHRSEAESWKEKLGRWAKSYGGYARTHIYGNSLHLNVDSPVMAAAIDLYIAGRLAGDKHLKSAAWMRSNDFLRALMNGYLEGDGSYDVKNDRWRLGFTRNYAWEQDLRTLAARLRATLTLKMATARYQNGTAKTFRGEWRHSESERKTRYNRNEIVRVRKSKARAFWHIGVEDQAHQFALASGVLTCNSKPNPMPESVKDRTTRNHEMVYMLAKTARYYYDQDGYREPVSVNTAARYQYGFGGPKNEADNEGASRGDHRGPTKFTGFREAPSARNLRSVWRISTQPYEEAHFATYPEEIPERCIKLGTSEKGVCEECGAPWRRVLAGKNPSKSANTGADLSGGAAKTANPQTSAGLHRNGEGVYSSKVTVGWAPICECGGAVVPAIVLDPFGGSGTTAAVATRLYRRSIIFELNPVYVELAKKRIAEASEKRNPRPVYQQRLSELEQEAR